MERYSTLHGTNQYGSYERLGTSQKMADFLTRKIGAANALDVLEAVEQTLKGFEMLPGFEEEPKYNRPMAVRYAPMYLYKKPNMPDTMKEFGALSVNGHEFRPDRHFTTFCHTTVFPFDLMHKSGEYNYLDQIFGTWMPSPKDLALSREAVAKGKPLGIDLDKLPAKVLPVMRKTDMLTVLRVAEALYTNRKVVIRLEKDYAFHARAWELLMQIYSLLYPKLATETGFAVYEKVEQIPELCRNTGIRIFVEPAGADLTKLESEDLVILDLENPAGGMPQNAEVLGALQVWYKMPWPVRQKTMELTFAGVESISNTDSFVQLTNEYVQAVREKEEWLANAPQNVETMAAVAAYMTKGTFWKKLPDAMEIRKAGAAKMLRPGLKVEALNAETAVEQFFAPEGSREKKVADAYFQVGSILGGVDTQLLRKKTAQRQEQVTAARFDDKIKTLEAAAAEAEATHQKKVDDLNTAHTQAMAEKDNTHQRQLLTLTQKHAQDLDTLKGEHETAMTNLRAAQVQKVNEINAAHTAEVATLNAATAQLTTDKETAERNLANAQNLLEQERQNHAAAMQQAQAEQRTAVFNAKAELNQQHQQEKAQMEAHYAAEKRNAEREHASLLEQERSRADLAERRAASVQRRLDAVLGGESIPEDLDLVEEEETNHGNGGKRRFDKDAPKMDMKVLAIVAAACLLVGALLGTLIGGLLVGGKDEETLPTKPPVTTTAPVETTQPVETTLPEETTVPTEPETTAPPETTVPEETTEPTEPGEVAKPEIDWITVPETTGLAVVETNETNMENLLNRFVTDVDVKPVAIVTVDTVGFVDGNGVRILPGEFAVLLEKTGEDATVEPNPEDKLLETEAALIMESTHYRLVIVGGQKMQEAAMKLFALAVPADDPAVTLTVVKEDGTTLTISQLLDEVLDEEPWWSVVTDVTVSASELTSGKAALASRLTPVAAIYKGMDAVIYILDYSAPEETGNAQKYVEAASRRAAAVDNLVAVVHSFVQG